MIMSAFDGRRHPRAALSALVTLTLVTLCPSLAGGGGSSARGELEEFFRRAIAIQAEAISATQARHDVRVLARTLFDGREASRRALGPEWSKRTSAERDDFARTFTAVLERAYIVMVQGRLPRDRPAMIRIVSDDLIDDRSAIVRTRVRTRDGRDLPLDYRMTRPDTAWLIGDVVIDGVSLVDNYRAQLARTRRRSSYAELMQQMRVAAGLTPRESIAASPGSPHDAVVPLSRAARAELPAQTP
jgi:ABC-type transporter MlaC component